ncbi:hypothetical protein PsYK624_156510 [Phanerochaete sordida]|uniref:Uncharacterized protein n=1 Tax=Phanerochaete sordida TaxID=48140 RepID=A0A9P3GPZ2_9APHY|nr:hypothetical protein PsYK624_156510 [Phanerochaete sordida]
MAGHPSSQHFECFRSVKALRSSSIMQRKATLNDSKSSRKSRFSLFSKRRRANISLNCAGSWSQYVMEAKQEAMVHRTRYVIRREPEKDTRPICVADEAMGRSTLRTCAHAFFAQPYIHSAYEHSKGHAAKRPHNRADIYDLAGEAGCRLCNAKRCPLEELAFGSAWTAADHTSHNVERFSIFLGIAGNLNSLNIKDSISAGCVTVLADTTGPP